MGASARLGVAAVFLAVASVAVILPPGAMRAGGQRVQAATRYEFNALERCFMRKINYQRARHGLRRLGWDKQLGYVARRHARAEAERRAIWHDQGLGREITGWRRLGQNTAYGGSCSAVFKALLRSRVHRTNILGRWRWMGVGVARGGGNIYVQQVFESFKDPGNIFRYP